MNEAITRVEPTEKPMGTSRWWQWVPPRIRDFFSRGAEVCFHSASPVDELIARVRSGLRSTSWGAHGASGYVLGSDIHVCWATGMFRDSFTPVFHGKIEAAGEGSIIRGRMSHSRFVQGFVGIWCGAIVLISLIFVWTIIMPLAGFGLLWAANGMMAIGESLYPGRSARILDFLRITCEPSQPSSHPAPGTA